MEFFETDHNLFSRPNAGDDQLFVVFYMGTLPNDARSVEEGRLIVDDVEAVRIMVPGDKTNVIDRPATLSDRKRFAKQYAAFREGKKEDEQLSGTRIKDWPFVSRAQIEELHWLGIKTVEQLAALRDDVVSRSPGFLHLKNNAVAWLAQTKDSALAAQQAAKMEEQSNRIDTLNRVIEDQAQRLEKLQAQMQRDHA